MPQRLNPFGVLGASIRRSRLPPITPVKIQPEQIFRSACRRNQNRRLRRTPPLLGFRTESQKICHSGRRDSGEPGTHIPEARVHGFRVASPVRVRPRNDILVHPGPRASQRPDLLAAMTVGVWACARAPMAVFVDDSANRTPPAPFAEGLKHRKRDPVGVSIMHTGHGFDEPRRLVNPTLTRTA